jgi:hypothetical protein
VRRSCGRDETVGKVEGERAGGGAHEEESVRRESKVDSEIDL